MQLEHYETLQHLSIGLSLQHESLALGLATLPALRPHWSDETALARIAKKKVGFPTLRTTQRSSFHHCQYFLVFRCSATDHLRLAFYTNTL
jgi:hypothetical protein